jgi:hypothetical protein
MVDFTLACMLPVRVDQYISDRLVISSPTSEVTMSGSLPQRPLPEPGRPKEGDKYGRKGIVRGVVDRGDHWVVSVSRRGTKLKSLHKIEKKG